MDRKLVKILRHQIVYYGLNCDERGFVCVDDICKYIPELNRVNNIPYGKRKGTIQKGWADLQGYDSEGRYVMVEIKKLGDKLSKEQIERFTDCWKCGSLVYICTEVDKKPTLVEWSKIKL